VKVILKNKEYATKTFILYHERYCASTGKCVCVKTVEKVWSKVKGTNKETYALVERTTPSSITLLARPAKSEPLDAAVLHLDDVRIAVANHQIIVENVQ
jgi:tRNA A37 threonylcarbamoyladenosine synthetase subunit TsaC/SUA5/YrdC